MLIPKAQKGSCYERSRAFPLRIPPAPPLFFAFSLVTAATLEFRQSHGLSSRDDPIFRVLFIMPSRRLHPWRLIPQKSQQQRVINEREINFSSFIFLLIFHEKKKEKEILIEKHRTQFFFKNKLFFLCKKCKNFHYINFAYIKVESLALCRISSSISLNWYKLAW